MILFVAPGETAEWQKLLDGASKPLKAEIVETAMMAPGCILSYRDPFA